jgi:hypothetical protein
VRSQSPVTADLRVVECFSEYRQGICPLLPVVRAADASLAGHRHDSTYATRLYELSFPISAKAPGFKPGAFVLKQQDGA